jgi:hypothetical protein
MPNTKKENAHIARYVVIAAMDVPFTGVHALLHTGKHCRHSNNYSDVNMFQTRIVAIIVTNKNIHFIFMSLIQFAIFVIRSIKC